MKIIIIYISFAGLGPRRPGLQRRKNRPRENMVGVNMILAWYSQREHLYHRTYIIHVFDLMSYARTTYTPTMFSRRRKKTPLPHAGCYLFGLKCRSLSLSIYLSWSLVGIVFGAGTRHPFPMLPHGLRVWVCIYIYICINNISLSLYIYT